MVRTRSSRALETLPLDQSKRRRNLQSLPLSEVLPSIDLRPKSPGYEVSVLLRLLLPHKQTAPPSPSPRALDLQLSLQLPVLPLEDPLFVSETVCPTMSSSPRMPSSRGQASRSSSSTASLLGLSALLPAQRTEQQLLVDRKLRSTPKSRFQLGRRSSVRRSHLEEEEEEEVSRRKHLSPFLKVPMATQRSTLPLLTRLPIGLHDDLLPLQLLDRNLEITTPFLLSTRCETSRLQSFAPSPTSL